MNRMPSKIVATALRLAFIAQLTALTSTAHAGFLDERKPSTSVGTSSVAATATDSSQALPNDGEWAKNARGFGRNVTVADALADVVPPGVNVSMPLNLPADVTNRKVSWRGNQPRSAVVEKIVSDVGLLASLSKDGKTLLVATSAPLNVVNASPSKVATVTLPGSSAEAIPGMKTEPASTAPAKEVWTIRQGYPIGQELKSWAKRANWTVVWGLQRDVVAPTTTNFTGDFASAASDVIRTLAENGALIHAQIFDGNHTLVVQGPGVAAQ